MTWTAEEQKSVGTALLGSWPGTITTWGREGFSAYIAELEARGLTAERVLVAVRTWPAGSDFPPSAPNLAAAARRDPGQPTFSETIRLIFGPGGVLSARTSDRRSSWGPGERDHADEAAMLERAASMHPLVGAFIQREGLWRLRSLNLDDEERGGIRRHELLQRWEQHLEATEGRDVVALAAPRRGGLAKLDPLAALGLDRPAELTEGDAA